MELYLTRHGQTVGNVQRILQGQQPGELTPLGQQQAQCLAQRLAGEHFDFVYCSDLHRCVQTLAPTLTLHPTLEPVFESRLREKAAGELEGQPLGTTDRLARERRMDPRLFRPSGGESWSDVQGRAQSFFSELCAQHLSPSANVRVLLVSHGGWIMEFLNVLRELKGQRAVYANKSQNTAVYVIRVERRGGRVLATTVLENDTSHLRVN